MLKHTVLLLTALLLAILATTAHSQETILCIHRNGTAEKSVDCTIEAGSFIQTVPAPTDRLIVAEYNLDRNGYGGDSSLEQGLGRIIDIFSNT